MNTVTDLDDASLKLLVDKKLPFELTIDDLVALEPADQFAHFVKWGLTPREALLMPFLPTATMLNYDWVKQIGTIEKGKYADVIAVSGDPLADISEMQRVRFVMKGGYVVKNEPPLTRNTK